MKKALILGVSGQDGSYLADFLLKKDYEVVGSYRRTSHRQLERLEDMNIFGKVKLVYADLIDQSSINQIIKNTQPDEIYNLAAQSFVGVSFVEPFLTTEVTGIGALRVLEAIREFSPNSKLYQASSSEMFGNSNEIKTENSRLQPASPYGAAKVFAHKTAQMYRESYDMFISCGILFNHESPYRGLEFVTRKITSEMAKIATKKADKIHLGNINAKRDWGYSGDYVKSMWMMLQQEKPSDYVVCTGESHSVKDFLEESFNYADLGDWQNYVEIDEKYFRPTDIDNLVGDASKARKELGWKPEMEFKKLVHLMVDHDMNLEKNR
ncbi:GDP-mannose 46-dehydratase protein [Marine Group I thaumarchaeote SCGC AAA799-P11]|uniref:GDP-mannose 4,6-dehydratase n=1 Tax=Marine Group I thaumarchaeote SCGC AAA799-P11 TaxID=1502295 RepID=A0A087S306_9ARCH|nr:GDP-mannose 46-dehydratase protein [Marine Group I thaumarchaeote SCGC AAA799-P11]